MSTVILNERSSLVVCVSCLELHNCDPIQGVLKLSRRHGLFLKLHMFALGQSFLKLMPINIEDGQTSKSYSLIFPTDEGTNEKNHA